MTTHQVVVVGAGYAGVIAADRVLSTLDHPGRDAGRRARQVEVTLVNPRPTFTERIRLHEVVAGTRASAERPLADVLHPRARVHVGAAQRIDVAGRRLVGEGWALPYDTLVYAVGSRTATLVPGSAQHAPAVGDPESADRLRRRLAGAAPGAVVAVVGGGLTGLETAAEIAQQHPALDVRLVAGGRVGPGLGDRAREVALGALTRLGVTVLESAVVTRVSPGRLEFADGSGLDVDACAWAASMVAPPLARQSGLPVDHLDRLLVDATLRVPGHPELVGAGDAVAAPDDVAGHLRMACATALPLGVHAASAVLARIAGRPDDVRPLSVGYVAQCVSLGRGDGVLQWVHRDDSPRDLAVGGRPAALLKELICRYTVAGMRAERRRPGGYPVVRGPRRAPQPAAVVSWSA